MKQQTEESNARTHSAQLTQESSCTGCWWHEHQFCKEPLLSTNPPEHKLSTARVLGSEQAARHGTARRFAAPAHTFPKPSLDHVQLRSLLLPFSLHSCGISKSATRLPPALLLAEGEGGIRRQAAEPPAKSREGARKVQNLLPRPQLMLAVSGVSTP